MCCGCGIEADVETVNFKKSSLVIVNIDPGVSQAQVDALHTAWKKYRQDYPGLPDCLIVPSQFSVKFLPSIEELNAISYCIGTAVAVDNDGDERISMARSAVAKLVKALEGRK